MYPKLNAVGAARCAPLNPPKFASGSFRFSLRLGEKGMADQEKRAAATNSGTDNTERIWYKVLDREELPDRRAKPIHTRPFV